MRINTTTPLNPVMMKHSDLSIEVKESREKYHGRLIERFDADLPRHIKKFYFICAILDPRFKKLRFEGDRMLTEGYRAQAMRWFTDEYNRNYKNVMYDASRAPSASSSMAPIGTQAPGANAPLLPHLKRRKVSSAGFFAARTPGASARDEAARLQQEAPTPATLHRPHADELATYLALPQIATHDTDEFEPLMWWKKHRKVYPNMEVMARQYLGCPASSATVERLFSVVGFAFSKYRKSAHSDTLEAAAFAKLNVE
mmetsp:Transcript_30411/g.92891  ORF Transcript_30411/g.92891 Transcript_30411/m.92891 type:complete len:256 (+) Transcript_30411:730-1497(+)|eukprot:scaffold34836_cov31-Tisochrysis_lutea.AAC.2